MDEPLFDAMKTMLDGQPNEDVIPVLITASARALVVEAEGDVHQLSTALLKFCRLVQNEAVDMFESEKPCQPV